MPWVSDLPGSKTSSESSPATPLSTKTSRSVLDANLLWLYSLLLSISCALTALSLRRWVRPRITLSDYSLPEQARLRGLFAVKIERANILIKLVHSFIFASLIVFFTGLLVFFSAFSAVNRPIFYPALFWTLLFFLFHASVKSKLYLESGSSSYTLFTQAKAEEQAPHTSCDILKPTLDMLRSDDDLEQFFEAIPGFCASNIVDNPQRSIDILGRQRLAEALVTFWNRTLSSNLVSESTKGRRLVISMRVIEAAELSIAVPQILHLFSSDLGGASQSVELGLTLRILRNGKTASLSRGVVASIISNAERNDRWFALAIDELGISGEVLRGYLTHGDSLLLANLIHITRQFFHSLLQYDLDLTITRMALNILPSVLKFDILNTLPELQHDFCALWNEIVQQVQSSGADIESFIDILIEIRHLYVALHAAPGYVLNSTAGHDDLLRQRTSYSLCTVRDHCSNVTTHLKEVSGNTIGEASHPTTTTSPILSESSPRDDLVTRHMATGITPSIDDNPISSMAPNSSLTPSSTGDVGRPNGRITVSSIVFDSTVTRSDCIFQRRKSSSYMPTIALSLSNSNPQAPTIFATNTSGNTVIPKLTAPRANDNTRDKDPTIRVEHTSSKLVRPVNPLRL